MADRLRVFLTHNPEDREAYYGRALPQLEALADVVPNPLDRDLTTPELIDAAAGCHVVVSHRSTPGEAALFDESPELMAFLRCAVDIRNVDVEAASAVGALVGHADKSFVPSTAELALGLMIDVARNISRSTVDYAAGESPPQRAGTQLRGSVAGIIGFGAIGRYLAELLVGLGMEVLVADPHVEVDAPDVRHVPFGELLAEADVVLPLAPASDATENLIDADALVRMKPGAMLVNVSRGELLDEGAVADALDRGHLGGLGMDVGRAPDQRPSPALAGRPGVVSTPHLGGLTPQNADAQAASSVEQVAAMVAGEMPPRIVDAESGSRLRAWWSAR